MAYVRRSRGEGHLKKYGKYWRGHLALPGSPRKYFNGLTKQSVVDKMNAYRAEKLGLVEAPKSDRNAYGHGSILKSEFSTWLARNETRLRTSTFRRYEVAIRLHLIPRIGHLEVAQVRHSEIVGLFAGMTDSGLSRSSLVQARAVLNQVFFDALNDGLIDRNPMLSIKLPRKAAQPVRTIPLDHAHQILQYASQQSASLFCRRYISLHLGLRQGEVLGLSWDDFDFASQTVTINAALGRGRDGYSRNPLKTEKSHRKIFLGQSLIELLEKVRVEQQEAKERFHGHTEGEFNPQGFVFVTRNGNPVGPRQDFREWCRALEALSLPHYRLHDCRHTVATGLYSKGMDIARVSSLLGHSTPAFTINTYVHRSAEDAGDAAKEMALLYEAARSAPD